MSTCSFQLELKTETLNYFQLEIVKMIHYTLIELLMMEPNFRTTVLPDKKLFRYF